MRKQWLLVCMAAGLLAACSGNDSQQQTVTVPEAAVCNGPVVEISGAEPQYEAPNPSVNQDYQRNGKTYNIVRDPANFTQTGLAAIYDAEPGSNLTASGEAFEPTQLTAAHPTLPVPGYARITNLANGRMLVVRINDRGPYGNDRVIALSRAAADRLNTSNNTKVRIDPIIVAPDGSLSGPGMACTTVARQTFALPARPDLSSGMDSASSVPQPGQSQNNVRAISNDTLKPENSAETPVNSSGLPPAPEQSVSPAQPAVAQVQSPSSPQGSVSAPVTAPGSVQGDAPAPVSASPTATSGNFVVQVGAVSDQTRAQEYQQRLSQQFSVPGRIMQNGPVWRIQLGPFSTKSDASNLQQRLQSEAQLQSFITHTH